MTKKATFAWKANSLKDARELIEDGMGETDKYTIVEKVELNDKEFKNLCKNFVTDRDYIKEKISKMRYDGRFHCILIWNKNSDFGLLVESEGFAYPRYCAEIKMSEVI